MACLEKRRGIQVLCRKPSSPLPSPSLSTQRIYSFVSNFLADPTRLHLTLYVTLPPLDFSTSFTKSVQSHSYTVRVRTHVYGYLPKNHVSFPLFLTFAVFDVWITNWRKFKIRLCLGDARCRQKIQAKKELNDLR